MLTSDLDDNIETVIKLITKTLIYYAKKCFAKRPVQLPTKNLIDKHLKKMIIQ